jgi:hypothetical protein
MSNYTNPSNKRYDRRHRLFLKANALTKKPNKPSLFGSGYENAWGVGDTIEALAKGYLLDIEDKVLVIINHVDKEIKYLPYKTRFDADYGKRIARRLSKIGYPNGVFFTGTLNPRQFSNLNEAYESLMDGLNKFLSAIRKRYPNYKGNVRVIEFQANGNPHVHMLIFGVDFIPVEWLRELWEDKYQLGTQINVKRIDNPKGAIRYLLKYLLKTFSGESSEEVKKAFRQKALLWALNSRGWAVSKSLFSLISERLTQTNGVSNWVFLGAFSRDCVGFSYFEFLVWAGFVT